MGNGSKKTETTKSREGVHDIGREEDGPGRAILKPVVDSVGGLVELPHLPHPFRMPTTSPIRLTRGPVGANAQAELNR